MLKRPYPESYASLHHRAPRVARLPDGRVLALTEPGWATPRRVTLQAWPARPASETPLIDPHVLVAPAEATWTGDADGPMTAGLWAEPSGHLRLAWADGATCRLMRTLAPVETIDALTAPGAWQCVGRVTDENSAVHLGGGDICPRTGEHWLATFDPSAGRVRVTLIDVRSGATATCPFLADPQAHAPTIGVTPAGDAAHLVWDTEDLRIACTRITRQQVRDHTPPAEPPVDIWRQCQHPDVLSDGREVIVAYTDHMHYVKYGWFDGQDWHRDCHLTTLHPRFRETLEHSPWLWMDADGVMHLSFVCLTRALVFDARWLGDAFADPQPVEGQFHPSLFVDDVRVKAERMSVERRTGTMLLSSSFCPEQHGVYQPTRAPRAWHLDEPMLLLDMAQVAEARNFACALEPLRNEPAEPILEPSDDPQAFDSARVLNGGTVLKDAGVYRMWYAALSANPEPDQAWYERINIGYAESDDGVNWRRVATGRDLTFHGRPAPNMIAGLDHNVCVFRDPSDVPARRYKAIKFQTRAQRLDAVCSSGGRGYLGLPRPAWLATSPDGLHWNREPATVDFPGPEFYGFTAQTARYEPEEPDPARRYKAIGWCSLIGKRRAATLAYSADALHWTVAERSPLLDPLAAVTPIRPAGPHAQIHDVTMARRGDCLLACYGHQFDGDHEDLRLAVSRDGERFGFIEPETPWVARGDAGAWNHGYMLPADLLFDGDEMVLYYGASAGRAEPSDGPSTGVPAWRVCAGRAVAKRDRFVAVRPREAGRSRLHTITLERPDDAPAMLQINARVKRGSALRVALLDSPDAKAALPGYELTACRPIQGDRVDHPVRWEDRIALPPGHRRLAVEIELDGDADDAVYAIVLRRPDSSASHADGAHA